MDVIRVSQTDSLMPVVIQNQATVMRTLNNIDDGAYHVEYKILDTQEHAVPQSRRRVYIIGILKAGFGALFSFSFCTLLWDCEVKDGF